MLRSFFTKNFEIFDNQIQIIVDYFELNFPEYLTKICAYAEVFPLHDDNKSVNSYTFNKLQKEESPDLNIWNSEIKDSISNNPFVNNKVFEGDENIYSTLLIKVNTNCEYDTHEIGRVLISYYNVKEFKTTVDELMNEVIFNHLILSIITCIYNRINLTDKFIHAINSYINLLKIRDRFMPYHSLNVADLSMSIYEKLLTEYNEVEKINLYFSALLHDVGKLFVPDSILLNNGELSDNDMAILKKHAIGGFNIIKNEVRGIDVLKNIPNYIRHHHEWYDGSGYPDRLSGEDIPLFSRIIMVADAIDAMLSERVYKSRMNINEVKNELYTGSGKQFDPKIVEIAIQLLDEKREFRDITINSDSAFIGDASLSFRSNQSKKMKVVNGNLLFQKNESTFILESAIKYSELLHAKDTIIFFISHGSLVQYHVEIVRCSKEEIIIKNLIWKPMDQFFSLMWEVSASIHVPNQFNLPVRVIRIGGNSLSFKVSNQELLFDEEAKFYKSQLRFELKIEEYCEKFKFDTIITGAYKMGSTMIFNVEFQNVLTSDRDRLFRLMFKKQLLNKRLK